MGVVAVVCIIQDRRSVANLADGLPCHRFATEGDLPDHHVLVVVFCQPHGAEALGVLDVRCPVATVRIELAPCSGLDGVGEIAGHVSFAVVCILEAAPLSGGR